MPLININTYKREQQQHQYSTMVRQKGEEEVKKKHGKKERKKERVELECATSGTLIVTTPI